MESDLHDGLVQSLLEKAEKVRSGRVQTDAQIGWSPTETPLRLRQPWGAAGGCVDEAQHQRCFLLTFSLARHSSAPGFRVHLTPGCLY